MVGQFMADEFFKDLDAYRIAKKSTWKKVAEEANVSASTLTRIAQGRRPDVDTLAALCNWSKLSADQYIFKEDTIIDEQQLPSIMAHLRADKNLSKEGAQAIEIMIKTAYEQFRQDK